MKKIIQLFTCIICLLYFKQTFAITLPPGFVATQLADMLDPVGMCIAPDGRLFFTEKDGRVRIIKNDLLLTAPFITLPDVDNYNEQGLFSVLLDPDFASNQYVYMMYTFKATSPGPNKNRVVRYTANGDLAIAGSELVLMEWTITGTIHNGGALAFGNDGKLYISTGESGTPGNAQTQTNLLGKILRLNSNGTIPVDNPFYTTNTGDMRAIYALGFRNPFKMTAQPGSGVIIVNDVGQDTWEEINVLEAGKNYGWPVIEGAITSQTPPDNYKNPLYTYNHSGGSCSIIGGNFYDPANPSFPSSYVGKYFYADYCGNYIKYFDPANPSGTLQTFATDASRILDIRISSQGEMYVIERNGIDGGSTGANTSSTDGKIWKIIYNPNGDPVVSTQPVSIRIPVGEDATFIVTAIGDPTLTYQWRKNNVDIPGANTSSYTLSNAQLSDDGTTFRCYITNTAGDILTAEATLSVVTNNRPVATFVTPASGTLYRAGENISFSATATDAEDGPMASSQFTWWIDFHHNTHTHPALSTTTGISSGSYAVLRTNETSANVWYRIYLKVTDSEGMESNLIYRDVYPQTAEITLLTDPASGLELLLDGQTVQTPYTFTSVVGITRTIEAPAYQQEGSETAVFLGWEDVATYPEYQFDTPEDNTTYTAIYVYHTTNVQEAVKDNLKLYPSPASEVLHLSATNFTASVQSVSIMDMMGKIIYRAEPKSPEITIPVSSFPKGMYSVKMESTEGTLFKSFVKE